MMDQSDDGAHAPQPCPRPACLGCCNPRCTSLCSHRIDLRPSHSFLVLLHVLGIERPSCFTVLPTDPSPGVLLPALLPSPFALSFGLVFLRIRQRRWARRSRRAPAAHARSRRSWPWIRDNHDGGRWDERGGVRRLDGVRDCGRRQRGARAICEADGPPLVERRRSPSLTSSPRLPRASLLHL